MIATVLDTGPLVALLNAGDARHAECAGLITKLGSVEDLVISAGPADGSGGLQDSCRRGGLVGMSRYRAVVTGSMQRPLLFLDVDGPLIPFGASPEQYPTYPTDLDPLDGDANPLLIRINPAHGPRLAALPCEVVWATTWMADANECIAPRIGLPQLAVVIWPEPSDVDDQDERNGLHWKTRALVEWAAGRSFAWVDDEVTDIDRSWVAAHHQGQALLHRVDPRDGLTDGDYAALDSWLRQLF